MSDQVGVGANEVEIAVVLFGQRVELEVDGRKIEAPSGLELDPLEATAGDLDNEAAFGLGDDRSIELAVVDRYGIANRQPAEHPVWSAGRPKREIATGRLDVATEQHAVADDQSLAIGRRGYVLHAHLGAGDVHEHPHRPLR